MQDTVQRAQPEGVPPLELTGERTLPDVPAENYWFRRHLAVYEWVAERCQGRDVVDMACGEGYGVDVLARRARQVTGVDANPEAHEHARLKYTRPGVRFVRDLVESYSEPCDAVVFLQTIEHVADPEAVLRHFRELLRPGGIAFVSTPNLLTLAPPGADKSDNPWHLKEYRAEEFRALCESVFDDVELLGVFHSRVLRAHELALQAGWDRVHAALGITKPFYDRFTPAISARDFALRPGPLERALDFVVGGSPGARVSVARGSRPGALALVLHSHMPYVEGFGTWPFGEEWLWEAVACVYLPLLDLLDGAPVTVGMTPVLCDQLEAMRGEPGERYMRFLREIRAPIHAEDAAGLDDGGEHRLAAEVRRAASDYTRAERSFEERGRDLISAFGSLDRVELWTSAATHALLPLIATDAGLRLQLATGTASHMRRFGHWSGGFWLPECAYVAGLERELADDGVKAFCIDQTQVEGFDHLLPVATEPGPVAVPIDWDTVQLVWNDENGYPAHPLYRNYWGRTVHDLRPWSNSGEPYDHEAALALAREHARDFVTRVAQRLQQGGLLCCALDTELLGHWWYEGQAWLGAVLEEAESQGVRLVTVSEGIELVEPVARELAPSTWGHRKDFTTWDAPAVAELTFAARAAELRAVAAVAGYAAPHAALERAARELLAMQASDWAFMVTRDLAGDYPGERMKLHGDALDAALAALTDSAAAPEPSLRGLAPHLDLAPLTTP